MQEAATYVIRRDEHELGQWTRVSRSPDLRLRPLLHRDYVGFQQDVARRQRWIEPAQPVVTLIIDLEEPAQVDKRRAPQAWVAGPSYVYDLVELGERYTCLDIKLTPLGAYTLLGTPLRKLADSIVGLDDLFGPRGGDLVEELLEASSWGQRFTLLDGFLLSRASEGPRPSPAVAWAWSRLCATAGNIAIGDLAADLRMSRRHLTSTFHEQVGLPPKGVSRLLRFARVCGLLHRSPMRWAEIAQDCGYFDQSHLNRDFRQFAGTTPTDFLARQLPGAGVTADGIPFVQDSAAART